MKPSAGGNNVRMRWMGSMAAAGMSGISSPNNV